MQPHLWGTLTLKRDVLVVGEPGGIDVRFPGLLKSCQAHDTTLSDSLEYTWWLVLIITSDKKQILLIHKSLKPYPVL